MTTLVDVAPPAADHSDGKLIEKARQGSEAAFAEIVERHKDQLVGYLVRLVGSRQGAEDIAQESFLRLYAHSSHYVEQGQLKAYLFRIATNLVRSSERRAFRWDRIRDLLSPDVNRNPSRPEQIGTLLDQELQEQLRQAIVALPLRYRAPIVLREVQGWSYVRISESLSCSTGTVKSRIHRGRQLLRRKLTPYLRGVQA